MEHKDSYKYGGLDPPFFHQGNDFDEAALEREYQESMRDPANQLRLLEFLAATDPDSPDTTTLEEEDHANQQRPEVQEQLQNFMADQKLQESLMQTNPFWNTAASVPMYTNATPSPILFAIDKALGQSHDTEQSISGCVDSLPKPLALTPCSVGKEARGTVYATVDRLVQQGYIVRAGGILYFYDGKAFLPCRRDEAKQRLLDLCRSTAELSKNPKFIDNVYNQLMIESRICRDADLFCNTVAFSDGLLDLDTGQFELHSPLKFVTTQLDASYRYGTATDCPIFKKFLQDISCGNSVLIQRIWECLGYLLVPDQSGKRFVLFQGVSNSGKSVLGAFVRNCFVGNVTTTLEINELRGQFTLADLAGKKFCADMDLPAEPLNPKALGKLKKLTGGDSISSDVKFSDRLNFICTAKLLFGSNHALILKKADPAFLNRLVVVPFSRSFNGREQDLELPRKLACERSAIIVRSLRAYQNLKENSFQFSGDFRVNQVLGCDLPDSVEAAVFDFLANRCELVADAWTSTETLYSDFVLNYGILCEKQHFSGLFMQAIASTSSPVEKKRNRISPVSNPVWGFTGITLKH